MRGKCEKIKFPKTDRCIRVYYMNQYINGRPLEFDGDMYNNTCASKRDVVRLHYKTLPFGD